MRRCLVAVAWFYVLVAAGTVLAQTADSSQKLSPHFDVVSITPSRPDEPWFMSIRNDGYRYMGRPLGMSILRAYLSPDVTRLESLVNAPEWVWKENYDFVGTISSEDHKLWASVYSGGRGGVVGRNDELDQVLQPMLQAALADRCKLVVHLVPATTTGYRLEVANPKLAERALKASTADEVIPGNALQIALSGHMVPIMSNEDPTLTFYQTSMGSLAAQIGRSGGKRVEDKTGLPGSFDFKLLRLDTNTNDPALLWDLRSLGLKLTPIEVPTRKVVIDHIERPTPN